MKWTDHENRSDVWCSPDLNLSVEQVGIAWVWHVKTDGGIVETGVEADRGSAKRKVKLAAVQMLLEGIQELAGLE